jgi:hypothetical protein
VLVLAGWRYAVILAMTRLLLRRSCTTTRFNHLVVAQIKCMVSALKEMARRLLSCHSWTVQLYAVQRRTYKLLPTKLVSVPYSQPETV